MRVTYDIRSDMLGDVTGIVAYNMVTQYNGAEVM